MARGRKVSIELSLSQSELDTLEHMIDDDSLDARVKERALILYHLGVGMDVPTLVSNAGFSKSLAYRIIKRYQEGGLTSLFDKERSGRPTLFSEKDKSFIRQIACEKPFLVPNGPELQVWDEESLIKYLREVGVTQGNVHLKRINSRSLNAVLSKSELSLNIKYDAVDKPESKTETPLIVPCLYKRLEFLVSSRYDYAKQENVVVMSYNDEHSAYLKSEGKVAHPNAVRNSILSLMVGINLLDCKLTVFPCFEHSEQNFFAFLQELSSSYHSALKVNLLVDHHKIHDSTFIKTHSKTLVPFINFVYEIEHPFYVNVLENMFSRLMRFHFATISASSQEELCEAISKSILKLNECARVNRWPQDLSEIAYLLK